MNAARRIRPIADLAGHQERNAARAMAEWRRLLERERQKLAELSGYREEYARHLGAGAAAAGRAVCEHRAFLARLNHAIAEQSRRVVEVERRYQAAVSVWERQRSRARALDKLVESHEARARVAELRREQREADEHALRRFGQGHAA